MYRSQTTLNSITCSSLNFDARSAGFGAAVTRILILKRDALSAGALRRACQEQFPEARVEHCREGRVALDLLAAEPHALVIMGLNFSDIDGIELLRLISERGGPRLLLVSGRKDQRSLLALRSIAFEGFYDPFEEEFSHFPQALAAVMEGKRYISPGLIKPLLGNQSIGILDQRLTPTELRVLSVIGDGADDQEASDRLGVAKQTVHTHRRNIMRKLEVESGRKLVREAIRLGVIQIGAEGQIARPGFGWPETVLPASA